MAVFPNLFLIGASKCGSTFLHHALEQHPEICMCKVKEPWFFSWDDYEDKLEWYLSLFEHRTNEIIVGESSPIYSETTYFPKIPRRLYKFNPDARIIYIVREPFSRLESVYKQTMSSGHWAEKKFYDMLMPQNFNQAVFEYPPFLEATKYWTHIQNYLTHFPQKQIKVIIFEKMIKEYAETMKNIFEFLEIDSTFLPNQELSKRNESKGKKLFNNNLKKANNLLPEFIKKNIPKKVKSSVKDFLKKSAPPVPNPKPLTTDEKSKVYEILTPEIKGLYSFLNLSDDPWDFFINNR